ncbi:MAG: NAD(P)H-hydrate dehydratase [Spirochaetaceae bacterium]
MKLVTSPEMKEIDRRAQEEYAIPGLLLMENAGQKGLAIWKEEVLTGRTGGGCVSPEPAAARPRRLVFVVGKGNNGGDALVMARQAFIERLGEIAVVAVDNVLKGHAALHLDVVRRLGITILPWNEDSKAARSAIRDADVLFDGIAGTGIRGGLRAPLSEMVEAVNASAAVTVAVDVPSGLADDYRRGAPLVEADLTLTMGLPKRCLYLPDARPACGEIRCIALGFPPRLLEADELRGELITAEDARRLVAPVSPAAYKHRRGVPAVFAGARGTTGAAVLSATAAARSTAGMVRLFVDEDVYPVVAAQCSSVMVAAREKEGLPELEGHHALLVGPGWGRGSARKEDLVTLVSSALPGVLDADGINVLAELRREGRVPSLGGRWVLTPHAGEAARLLDAEGREVLADAFERIPVAARELDAVICLKSHVTVIAAPDGRYAVVDGMNPAMATGGAGDVLSGIIAAFIARGAEPFDAARAGCVLHDRLGKRLWTDRGYFLAEDLLGEISAEVAGLTGS